jgi:predicted nucleotidyltransferase
MCYNFYNAKKEYQKGSVMTAWDFLNENEKKAVEALKSRLEERFEVRDMRLFGSKVRGQAGPDSDVDIMIELPKRSLEIESEIDDIAFEVNLRNDSFITTIVFGQDELQQGPMKESPIYKTIRKEGIPV